MGSIGKTFVKIRQIGQIREDEIGKLKFRYPKGKKQCRIGLLLFLDVLFLFCVCVCVSDRERKCERERDKVRARERESESERERK